MGWLSWFHRVTPRDASQDTSPYHTTHLSCLPHTEIYALPYSLPAHKLMCVYIEYICSLTHNIHTYMHASGSRLLHPRQCTCMHTLCAHICTQRHTKHSAICTGNTDSWAHKCMHMNPHPHFLNQGVGHPIAPLAFLTLQLIKPRLRKEKLPSKVRNWRG